MVKHSNVIICEPEMTSIVIIIFIFKHSVLIDFLINWTTHNVLATLVLFSFTKLLRTVALCLSSDLILCKESLNEGSKLHWYIDSNILFFKHNNWNLCHWLLV